MGKEKDAIGGAYKSFEQLFNDAASYMDAIKGSIKPNTKHYDLAIYDLEFSTWLTDKCNWNGDRDMYYDHFLTKDFFKRFMEYKTEQENELIAALEQERQSWEIRKPEITTQKELTKKEKTGLTQRQKAIILYFMDKAEKDVVPINKKKEFIQKYQSTSLYHEWVNVCNANNIDEHNLEKAIEFITDPDAKKLAVQHLTKIRK